MSIINLLITTSITISFKIITATDHMTAENLTHLTLATMGTKPATTRNRTLTNPVSINNQTVYLTIYRICSATVSTRISGASGVKTTMSGISGIELAASKSK